MGLKIIQDLYFDKFGKDRKQNITEVVVHGLGSGQKDIDGFIGWMKNPGRPNEYRGSSGVFHYLIGLNGEVYQFMSLTKWGYHSFSADHDEVTIGVELFNRNSNRNNYTEMQYATLTKLIIEEFLPLYPGIKEITGHSKNALKYSPWYVQNKNPEAGYICPGKNFIWTKFENYIKSYDYVSTIDTA